MTNKPAVVWVVMFSTMALAFGWVTAGVLFPAPVADEPSAAWYQCNKDRSMLRYELAKQGLELTRWQNGLE